MPFCMENSKRRCICNNLKDLLTSTSTHVCKLKKPFYGLKQTSYVWFECFTQYLLTFWFIASHADPFLFVKKKCWWVPYLYPLLYIDDIILIDNDNTYINVLVEKLKTKFDMTDLGALTFFLVLKFNKKLLGFILLKLNMQLMFLKGLCHTSSSNTFFLLWCGTRHDLNNPWCL